MICFIRTCKAEMKKQMRNYSSDWTSYFSLLLWPILILFTTFFTYYSFEYKSLSQYGFSTPKDLILFLVSGALVYHSFWTMVQGALMMNRERQNGTLEMAFMTPANRMALMYGRALGGGIQNAWMFICFSACMILLVTSFTVKILLSILFIYIFLLISATVWGGFIGTLFLTSRDSGYLFTICDEPMNFFSGTKIPIESFPLWAKIFSSVFPTTYCIYLVREIFMKGTIQIRFIRNLCVLLFAMIILTGIILKMAEENLRKNGSLQLY